MEEILCAVESQKKFVAISQALSKSFVVVAASSALDALKKSMNGEYELYLVDDSVNKSLPEPLVEMWTGIESTKDVPRILSHDVADTYRFSETNFLTTFGLEDLETNIKAIISRRRMMSANTADIKTFMESLILALEAKDVYSRNHSARVACFSAAIAKYLGLPEPEVDEVSIAGFFHDIGKIGIPDGVLLKPGKLNDEEFHTIQGHPVISEKICHPIHYFAPILPIIRGHHERVDGNGYPDKKVGEDVPFGARIVAVADAFDALTSNRPYREAFSLSKVEEIMRGGAGTQWDARVIDAFWKNISVEKIVEMLSTPTQFVSERTSGSLLDGTAFGKPIDVDLDDDAKSILKLAEEKKG